MPYLYFVSRNDGTHVFAETLTEHNANVQKFQVEYFRAASVTTPVTVVKSKVKVKARTQQRSDRAAFAFGLCLCL